MLKRGIDPFGNGPRICPTPPKSDYLSFLRRTLPPGWTSDARHIRLICQSLDDIEDGVIDRLAIHMPPRHGKTENGSVRYAPYALQRHPASNVLLTGYNERFAARLGRKARIIAMLAGFDLDPGKQASDEWAMKAGGVLMTRGVGSPPTGTGFRRIVIDDPIRRREDAESEVYREKCWDWYTDDLYTRLEPDGAIVLIGTPWHEDDILARAVASEPGRWRVIRLAAIADIENDPIERNIGEALWPERFNVPALERIRDVMAQNEGLRSWEALYQCNPTAREGSFFKVGKIEIVDAVPADLKYVRAWDIAASADRGDYTVGVKMGHDGRGTFYIPDIVRGQWATDDRDRIIKQTAQLDGNEVKIRGPQDPGAAGVDASEAFVRNLAGFPVRIERVSGKKDVRADPFSSQVNAGNVKILKGAWNRAYIEELRSFTGDGDKHDDQVDASADAFNELISWKPNTVNRLPEKQRQRSYGFA